MIEERKKWNQRYLKGRRSPLHTTLIKFYKFAKPGKALDIACGTGENSIFLAEKGFEVIGVDVSDVAIKRARIEARKKGAQVKFKPIYALKFSYHPDTYNLLINFYFLERRLFPKISRCIKSGGVLIFETYNKKHSLNNPYFPKEYLLTTQELIRSFREFEILHYSEEGAITTFVGIKT